MMTCHFDDTGQQYVWARPCECGCGKTHYYKGDFQGYLLFVQVHPKFVSPGFGGIILRRPKTLFKGFTYHAN